MSTLRRVQLDFHDGNGYVDVSHLVVYDSLTIQRYAFNDQFRFAQNEIAFKLLYDADIFSLLVSTDDVYVRVYDVTQNIPLTTEESVILMTEDGRQLLIEQERIIPFFQGHLATSVSRTYNGYDSNTMLSVTGTDLLDNLEQPVGDILFSDYVICDPANPATSIVHQLVALCGWPSYAVDSTQTIDVSIARFAPNDPDDTVLEILSTLLYEYGYAPNIAPNGLLTLVPWMHASTDEYGFEFNMNNIISQIQVTDDRRSYDGVKTTYYDLKKAEKVLLYMDDNCGYDDSGNFVGYPILAGYTYPPESNVIDETTGLPTLVYQSYTDTGIKYRTNKAILNNLDYNRDAFTSDFSSIVATENHISDAKYDAGIIKNVTEFFNKRCRILFTNPTEDDSLRLYYNNVYGDIWYRSSERTSVVDIIPIPNAVYQYKSAFLFSKTHADVFTKALASQYKARKTRYTFTSEENVAEGTLVHLLLDDGTDSYCVILSAGYDERTQLYSYTLMQTGLDAAVIPLTAQTTKLVAMVDLNYTQPVISGAVEQIAIVAGTPRYLGTVTTAPSTSLVTIVKGPTTGIVDANIGDWVLMTTTGTAWTVGECYRWNGNTWERLDPTTHVEQYQAALYDILSIASLVTDTGYFGALFAKVIVAQKAAIDELQTKVITLSTTGVIRSANYDSGVAGFRIGADGQAEFNNIVARGSVYADTGVFSGGMGLLEDSTVGASTFGAFYQGTSIMLFGHTTVSAPVVYSFVDAFAVVTCTYVRAGGVTYANTCAYTALFGGAELSVGAVSGEAKGVIHTHPGAYQLWHRIIKLA